MLPSVDIHGTWVRSLRHDMFGRLAYKVINRNGDGRIEFLVLWEPDDDMGTKTQTSSYHDPEELMVRSYKPKPWMKNPPKEVIY